MLRSFLETKAALAGPRLWDCLLCPKPSQEGNEVRKGLSHKHETKNRQFQGAKNANHLQASVRCSTMDPVWEVGGPAAAAQAVCEHPPPPAVNVSRPVRVPAESPCVCALMDQQ